MISSPMFVFGAPMYYAYPSAYNTATQVYNNGTMVRNFFTKDNGYYMSGLYGFLRSPNYAYYYGGGRGASGKSNKTSTPAPVKTERKIERKIETNTETQEPSKPKKTEPVTNPVKTSKPDAIQTPAISGRTYVDIAKSYSNCTESNGSHHKFCINPTCKQEDPYDQEWCTDFVTYVVKEAYDKAGKTLPAGFGDHDVETMKKWAIKNNMYINTANKAQKGRYIVQNIKPGDIFIMNENGASHTGFVTKIDKDTGVIHTIEGNRDDRVKEYKYSPNNPDLSGFIRMK